VALFSLFYFDLDQDLKVAVNDDKQEAQTLCICIY